MASSNSEDKSERIHVHVGRDDVLADMQAASQKHEKGFSGVVKLAVILFFFFWVSLVLLLPYAQWKFDSAYIFETIESHFNGLFAFLFNTADSPGMAGRFCQCLAAVIAGSALASCGAVFQGSFKNVLAGPSTMGAMGGGMLGCLIFLLVCYDSQGTPLLAGTESESDPLVSLFLRYGLQFLVFIGCLLAVGIVLAVSFIAGRGRVSAPAMIISGTVLSTMVGNLTNMIQYYMIVNDPGDVRIESIRDLMLGNFNDVSDLQSLFMFMVPVVICLIILIIVRNKLNLLSLGEDEASVMGMNVRFYRIAMVAIGTILTASVVAFCGQIGFLGFMVPLIGRKLAGPDMRFLIPSCMLIGGILLLAIYDVAYFVGMPDTLNIFTSILGCIVMVVLLVGKRGGARSASFEGRDMANVAQ